MHGKQFIDCFYDYHRAHEGVLGDGSQVERVLEPSGGVGAEVVVDVVGENGSTAEG